MESVTDDAVDSSSSSGDEESKRARFLRIAPRRTQQVLVRLRILGNCANRGAYEYEPADVEKIFQAIMDEMQYTRRRFERRKRREDFQL